MIDAVFLISLLREGIEYFCLKFPEQGNEIKVGSPQISTPPMRLIISTQHRSRAENLFVDLARENGENDVCYKKR